MSRKRHGRSSIGWQARREAAGPPAIRRDDRARRAAYGKTADDPSLLTSGIGRAAAMAYRDARGQAMTDPDWSEIECRLRRAYRSLQAAVAGGAREGTRGDEFGAVACRHKKSPGRCRGF
jgi:hypothetical protein